MKTLAVWGKVVRLVTKNPIESVSVIGTFFLVSGSHVFTMTYEFDTMKSFPDDMPSIEGYENLEDKFEKGDLAPTTVLFESKDPRSEEHTSDSSHVASSYAVFCLKKKKNNT